MDDAQRRRMEQQRAAALLRRQQAQAQRPQLPVAAPSAPRAASMPRPPPPRPAFATGGPVSSRFYNRTQSAHPYGRGNSNQFARFPSFNNQNAFPRPMNANLSKAEFSIVSRDLFKVQFTGVQYDVQRRFASLARFNRGDIYNFPWSAHQAAVDLCKELNISVSDIPKGLLREWRTQTNTEVRDDELLRIDDSLVSVLRPFQRIGIKFGISKNGRVLVADDMGLGKTIQGLGIARYYREEWPLLIVCPSSVKTSWIDSIERFLPTCTVKAMDTSKDVYPATVNIDTVFVTSYDMLTRNTAFVKNKPRVLIFDESHLLKTGDSRRTKAAQELAITASRVILLSGTPAISRPVELFPQVKMLNPRIFPNFTEYAMRYCDGQMTNYGLQAKGATHTDELKLVLNDLVMIRREKSDVDHMLPTKTRTIVTLKDSNINTRLSSLEELRKKTGNVSLKGNGWNNSTILEFFRETAVAKAPASVDYILNMLKERDTSEKLLVFGHHSFTLDTVCAALSRENIRHIRIDGTTMNRGELCNDFQTDPKVRVAVLSLTAAGVGITLTAASLVVFAELYFVPGALLQAEDRVHRLGQTKPVEIYYLVANKTADEQIMRIIQGKLDVLRTIDLNSGNFHAADNVVLDSRHKPINSFFKALSSTTDTVTIDD